MHRTDVGDEPKGTGGELPTHQNGAVSVHLATLAMLRRASRLDDERLTEIVREKDFVADRDG